MDFKYLSLGLRYLLVIALVFTAFSCSDDDDEVTYRYKEAPVLLSVSPEDGAAIEYESTVEFTFDRPVTIVDASLITLSGDGAIQATVDGVSKLIVKLTNLDYETTYTLNVAEGAIKGVPGIMNQEAYKLTLKTGNAPELNKTLATPNASAEAQKLFKYLLDNYGAKTISGTMAKVAWNTDEAERVYRWTGKYPAINTFDFVHLYASPASWIDYSDISVVENWSKANGIVSLMWHWNVPASEGSSDYAFYATGSGDGNVETTFDITKTLVDGSYENKIIKADIEKMATHLLALQAKKIPVIWRPLHEAAGGWFWWGKNSDAYKALWKYMFDTFKAKGINNLIWVWTTEGNDAAWYPGDAYVDIVGRDIYNKTEGSDVASLFKASRREYPTKMVTLSECGNVADITKQWTAGAKWSWFMPWYDYDATDDSDNQHAGKDFWKDAFSSDLVITRDKLPSFK